MLLTIFALIIAICAMYFYKKFRESEEEYYELHIENVQLKNDNTILTNRINDLQVYNKDIFKTVHLLNNEVKDIKSKINNDDYLNSINNNTLIMDKSLINSLLNEMPDIIANKENIQDIKNEEENKNDIENKYDEENESKFIDLNMLNYDKYRI